MMKNKLLTILVLILAILVIFLFIYIQCYNSRVYFNSMERTSKIIANNKAYFEKFNVTDFQVRKCDSSAMCIDFYTNNIAIFSDRQQSELYSLCNEIDNYLIKFPSIHKVKWKFSKMHIIIENGFPHTHDDTIFLTDSFFNKDRDNMKETLLHEKIHVYQRLYKNKTQNFYKSLGFIPLLKKENNCQRSNPDIDEYDYIFGGNIVNAYYKKGASRLSDIKIMSSSVWQNRNNQGLLLLEKLSNTYNIQIEHPNEIFACIISMQVLRGINFEKYFKDLNKYINIYLK